jgi:hypothetical protein
MIRFCFLLLLACAAGAAQASESPPPLPPDSIYRLEAPFSDQAGVEFTLAQRRGRPQLVAMFYTSCKFVCPLIIDSAKGVEHGLTPEERERLGIVLVSLDPARDDTAALKSVAAKRKLDPARCRQLMTVVWGIVGMLVGVIIAAQLAWPALNFDLPWLSYGRLRPLHTNAVIFAFGGCALFATSYYIVQRTCHARLFATARRLRVLGLAAGDRAGGHHAAAGLSPPARNTPSWNGRSTS